jgi:uncharacterized membrane protein YhhN
MTIPFTLVVIAAVIALAYGVTLMRAKKTIGRAAVKTLPVALLAIAALMAGTSPLFVAALAFCAAGDWFLAFDGERNFLFGLGSFLAGHLLYTAFFLTGVDPSVFLQSEILMVIAFLTAIGVMVNIRLWPHAGDMRIPVIVYSIAIMTMVASARAANLNSIMLAGVIMFMVSDIILARETFLPAKGNLLDRMSDYLVWYLYSAGQVLIVWGLLFAA